VFYLVFWIQSNPRKYHRAIVNYIAKCKPYFALLDNKLEPVKNEHCYRLFRYLQYHMGFPLCTNTRTEYFSSGEAYFARLMPELEKAQRYIFVETFIIESGFMFESIMNVLSRKAKAGVDVRVMYDDLGSFATQPDGLPSLLAERGIKCQIFNPFRPVLSSLQNNRDHRKIISIDGIAAFTGGVNIGDEYINRYEKYGHWKDSALLVEGEAAWSLTMIFLRLWNLEASFKHHYPEDNYADLFPWKTERCTVENDGFVQPYAGSPITKEYVCEKVYLHIINAARDYIYINTPYLIPNEAMIAALILAVKSGADVRIMTPHRADKPLVFMVTRSYYRMLVKLGIKIYEYSAGFNHSKTFVADDTMATVGTANLDFRSLCLDYECAVFMYKSSSIKDIKENFLSTIKTCKSITLKDCARNAFVGLVQDVMRLFAPIM
jgi:cardiolipin synthase